MAREKIILIPSENLQNVQNNFFITYQNSSWSMENLFPGFRGYLCRHWDNGERLVGVFCSQDSGDISVDTGTMEKDWWV